MKNNPLIVVPIIFCLAMILLMYPFKKEEVTILGRVDYTTLTTAEKEKYPEEKTYTLISVKDKTGKVTKEYIKSDKLENKTFPYTTTKESSWCGCSDIK